VAIAAYGLTDVGRKRRHNEDAYLLDAERGLFVVADGMGGHAAGEVASRITVESIQEFIAGTEEEHENTWPFGFNNRYSLEGNRLTTAVEKANEKVMRAVQNRPELKGMGTTVVAALFEPDRATLVHVGDSRAYLLRKGVLQRLTDDHSWVQEQVNAGILSEDEAKTHPLKNVVTRALGGAAHVAVDLIEVPIHQGDRFLLCSDGLTGMVSDEQITEHMSADNLLEKVVRGLVEMANEHGGVDNVTAIVVEVKSVDSDRRQTQPMRAAVATETTRTTVVTPHSQMLTAPMIRPVLEAAHTPAALTEGSTAPPPPPAAVNPAAVNPLAVTPPAGVPPVAAAPVAPAPAAAPVAPAPAPVPPAVNPGPVAAAAPDPSTVKTDPAITPLTAAAPEPPKES